MNIFESSIGKIGELERIYLGINIPLETMSISKGPSIEALAYGNALIPKA